MSFHKSPSDRPRQVKRFVTVRDVEDLAQSGARTLRYGDDVVVTAAAMEVALDLGLELIKGDTATANAADLPVKAAPGVALPAATVTGTATQQRAESLGESTSRAVRSDPEAVSQISHARTDIVRDALVESLVGVIRQRWRPAHARSRQLAA